MSEVPLKVLGPLAAEGTSGIEHTFVSQENRALLAAGDDGGQAMLAVTPGPKTRNPKPET